MTISLDDVVQYIDFQRLLLEDIVVGFNKGNRTRATQRLARRYPTIFNDRNLELFTINAATMESRKRYTGAPYYTHPLSASLLFLYLADKLQLDVDGDTTIGYILTHDLVDEAARGLYSTFSGLRKQFLPDYADEVATAILLSGPSSNRHIDAICKRHEVKGFYNLSRAAKVMQVQAYGNPEHAYALIADALDNQLDTTFLDRDTEDRRHDKMARLAAFTLFAASELEPQLGNLAPVITDLVDQHIEDAIPMEKVEEYLQAYHKMMDTYRSENGRGPWNDAINHHFATYGFDPYTYREGPTLRQRARAALRQEMVRVRKLFGQN